MQRLTRIVASAKSPTAWVFAACLVVLLFGYFRNDLRGPKGPYLPPGDGQYHPQMARGDGHMLFLITRSIVFDRDLNFDNDLKQFGDPWNQPRTKTGQKEIPHPIGPALVWAPMLVVAHALSKVVNLFGANIANHGYTMFHQRVVFLSSPLFAFFATLFGWLVTRRWVGGKWAGVYGFVAALMGTSLLYYATYMPSYGHAMDAFFCSAFVALWALTLGQLRWRRFIWLGLLLGVAALIRTQDLAFGIVLVVEIGGLVIAALRDKKPVREIVLLLARGAVVLGVALLMFLPQVVAWKITEGEWFHAQNGPRYVRFAHPQILELLFSSKNGWFSTTPLAYAAALGLFVMPKRARMVQLGLITVVFSQVYLNSCIMDWWGQAAYGQRRLCSVTAVLVVGFAALMRIAGIGMVRLWRTRRRTALVICHVLAVAFTWWFVVWNWNWISEYRDGKAAGRGPGGLPLGGLTDFERNVALPIYRAVGNPFAFPANVLFGWHYGVPPHRWEEVVGDYVWDPPHDEYNDGRYLNHKETWPIAHGGNDRYIVGGMSAAKQVNGRWVRAITTASATTLVPIMLPEIHRFTLPVSGAAVIKWNGRQVGQSTSTTFADVAWDAPIVVGMNELTIEPMPTTGGDVDIGDLTVAFPH